MKDAYLVSITLIQIRIGVSRMSHDISTVYTRNLNKTSGRRWYGDWKRSKDTIISPKAYGGFIQERNGNKRR